MSITAFNPREEYIGTGALAEYTFDFKITDLEHLLVIKTNASNVEVFRVRGSDTTYIDSVEFDSINGGGTVYLVDEVESGYNLYLILADDEPLQESEFRDKGDFTLKRFENILDILAGAIQRLAYLCKRAVKLPEIMVEADADAFDTELPVPVADRVIGINSDADGFELVNLQVMVDDAVAAAMAAYVPVTTFGTTGAPRVIAAATGITEGGGDMDDTSWDEVVFVQGAVVGNNTIAANPQITPHTKLGARMTIIGTDDIKYIILQNGNGLKLNGAWSSYADNVLFLMWNGTVWAEIGRKE